MRGRVMAWIGALACCLGTLLVAPAADAARPRVAGWVITRTGRGAVPLTGRFSGRSGSSDATAVLFALTGSGRARRLSGAFTTGRIDWGIDLLPRVHGGPQPACQAGCTDPVGARAEYGFSSNGHATDATVYVATSEGVDVTVTVTSPGWRVSRWTPSMRVVGSGDAGDVGVRALHMTAGRFTGARAPGGRYGSLAWARLPCDMHGEGRAEFTGGRPVTLACDGRISALRDVPRATQWRLAGEATGVGSVLNLLVVVDFPRERR